MSSPEVERLRVRFLSACERVPALGSLPSDDALAVVDSGFDLDLLPAYNLSDVVRSSKKMFEPALAAAVFGD